MHFRRFELPDLSAVLNLHESAMVAIGAFLGEGPWNDDLKDIPGHYLNNAGDFLVVIENEKLVAMGAFRKIDAQTAEIKRMRTEPEYQGRGLGKRMYQELEKRARGLGYGRLILETSTIQPAALALYGREGYREFKRENVGHLEVIWMEKELGS